MTNPLLSLPPQRLGASADSAAAVTVLLHGRGGSIDDIATVVDRLALPNMAYLAVPAAEGTWYPKGFLAPRDDNQPHLDWALERLEGIVSELVRTGRRREHIALLGFSQGACLALEYAFRHPTRWGAVVAFTGGLIGPPETRWEAAPGVRDTPILLTDGDTDPWVPLARVRESADVFRLSGAAVSERVYPAREHLISDDEIAAGRGVLMGLLAKAVFA